MNSLIDFVQSLQEMKKQQVHLAGQTHEERAQILRSISQKIREQAPEIATVLANHYQLPLDFTLKNEVEASARIFDETAQIQKPTNVWVQATGLITLIVPEFFSVRILAERLAPALLAGNGVFVLLPPKHPVTDTPLREVFEFGGPVKIFEGGEELKEVMVAHPSVQAVSAYETPEAAEKTLKLLAGSWKKVQVSAGYHNSALVLNDVNLAQVAEKLVESCFTGLGQWPWNISSIDGTDTQLERFREVFRAELQKKIWPEFSEKLRGRMEILKNQLLSEKAKVWYGGESDQPLVVEDLSHCSTLQQDCLQAPVVLISPVKYVHEMVKWANVSYFGMYAQVFGPAEKVEKFGSQLNVSQVGANSWIESMATLPQGMKQSFSGIRSLHPFDDFFSDQKKFDGLESKN